MDLWLPPKPAIIIPAPKDLQAPPLDPRIRILGLTMMARTWALRGRRAEAPAGPPTIVAAGTVATGTTSLSIPYYAGLAANDIAFVWATATSTPTIETITDFTSLAQLSSSDLGGRLAWKRLTGSESGNVSLTLTGGEGARGVMIGVRGAIGSGTPYEGAGTNAGSSTSQTSASIVTSVDETLGLRFGGLFDIGWGGGTPPGGWTELVDSFSGSFASALMVDYKDIATAGTEAASTRTVESNPWCVQTLAVLPA